MIIDKKMDGTLNLRRERKRHPKIWSLIMGAMLVCIMIPLYASFSTQENFSRSLRNSLLEDKFEDNSMWRMDISSNYSINMDYWKEQEEKVERHYYFNISTIQEDHSGGISRTLTVINGLYPGPLIEASSGDTIVVHVENQMLHEPVTIHWHGLLMKEQSFNDGSPWINQCPIPPGGAYEYKIKIEDDQYGTYWYHSHYGTQCADGIFGPLVIHSKDELKELSYDKEIVIMTNDYHRGSGYDPASSHIDPDNGNTDPDNGNTDSISDNELIYGRNLFNYVDSRYLVPHGISDNKNFAHDGPFSILNLDPNFIYRIRVINADFFLPFELEVDGHVLEVIEADGTLVEPIRLKSLRIAVAQRYSFILLPEDIAFSQKNYWMHARFGQSPTKEANPKFATAAVVSYNGNSKLVERNEWTHNCDHLFCKDFDPSYLKTLKGNVPSTRNNDSSLPDLRLDINILFMNGAYQLSRGYLNDKTYLPLQNGSTMYQLRLSSRDNSIRNYIDEQLLTFNENQYMINLNRRGQVIDIILNNYDGSEHPFHLHGHKFWVLAVGGSDYFRDEYYDVNGNNTILNFYNAIFRDTVNIPRFGWAALRFVIDNPGVWPFHCHIGWHVEAGLLLQINELQEEYSNWNHYPKNWLSHCEHWQNSLY